jgi:hypothetical protein
VIDCSAYQMKPTGPACTEAMNGAEEAIRRERERVQAGPELSGGLGLARIHFGYVFFCEHVVVNPIDSKAN